MTRSLVRPRNPTDGIGEALRRNALDQELTLGPVRVRAGDLPLFRREDVSLLQGVRLVVDSPAMGPLRLAIRRGDRVLDHTAIPSGRPQSALLFVPEVTAPTELVLQVGTLHAPIRIRPQRKWRVFLIHQSHLDIGYTDPQDRVLRNQAGFLDAAIDLAHQSCEWPDEARFRWNVETTWPLQHWLRTRPAGRRNAFMELVRNGVIEVCALPFTMHTEAYSIDELARQLEMADRLRAEYGIPITTAMQTDVPGATLGLLELLAAAQVRYLSVAHNYAGRSVPYRWGGQQLTRPFRWRAPSGRQLLVWHTDTLHGSAYMEGNALGLAEGYERTAELLPEYLAALATRAYPYQGTETGWMSLPPDVELTHRPYPFDVLHLRVQGEFADNAPPSLVPAEVARHWNEEWAYPQLRMATNREFFETVEAELGGRVETYQGDWTDWWADGIGSAARELALNREAQALAPVAQSTHALAGALDVPPDPTLPREGGGGTWWRNELDDCYAQMALFDEHTWGAANPWADGMDRTESGGLQWQRKAGFALGAHDRAHALHEAGAARLGRVLGCDKPAVAVFNPSAWTRTDLVEVFLPDELADEEQVQLIDPGRGQPVAFELLSQAHGRFRPRGRWLRFVARDVPGLGYRRLLLRGGSASNPTEPSSEPLENEHYRLELDPAMGHVTSLRDRRSDREIFNCGGPFGFNQYVYDRYTSAPHFNHLSSRMGEAAGPWLLGSRTAASDGIVTQRVRTPIGRRLTVRLTGEGAAGIETTYELLHGVPRLDIRNRIQKLATSDKESVFFAFPFAIDQPVVSWEITGGVDTTSSPRVPGSARHMRAIRHWLTLEKGDLKVAWASGDAPLVQVGMLHLPYSPFPPTFEANEHEGGTVFSWAMNNIWDTNFPSQQGGETVFRYAVGSADATASSENRTEGGIAGPSSADPRSSVRFPSSSRHLGRDVAAGMARPLVGIVCRPDDAPKLPDGGSFCDLDGAMVDVVTVAPSRRGGGLTLFLHSLAPEESDVRLRFPLLPVTRAWTGNSLERDLEEVPLRDGEARIRIAPGEYRALTVELTP